MPIGSKFDDFLKEEGIFEITTAAAIKSVLRLGSTSVQLLLGSTTAKIDTQHVRLYAIQATTDSDPNKERFFRGMSMRDGRRSC